MKNILDLPQTTIDSGIIIRQKKFLSNLYKDFYLVFKSHSKKLPQGPKLELGSGGGFIKEVIPDVITSDIIKLPICDKLVNAEKMPFKNSSLSAIYMLNTFHHIKNPQKALTEFQRTLKKSGKIIMIEPYNSFWGRFIYKNFHYEGFDQTANWKIKGTGPLSDANNALPWIIFERDRNRFEKLFPNLKITYFNPHTPLIYLLSGGLKKHQLVPTFSYQLLKKIEYFLSPFYKHSGMFVTIIIQKTKVLPQLL